MRKVTSSGTTITMVDYNKYSGEEWKGAQVSNVVELSNGLVTIPVGTVLEITSKVNGFSLTSKTCSCCQIKAHFTKVKAYNLRLIEAAQ
jgi:hypothetical protein